MHDKIAKQFSKAVDSYDLAAQVQWQSGIDIIKQLSPQNCDNALDIGCATGKLSQELAISNIDLLDISETMLNKAAIKLPKAKLHHANFEFWQSQQSYDLVFSHFVFQWFEDLEQAIAKAKQLSQQQLSISFPIQPSLQEINQAAHSLGIATLLKYQLPSQEHIEKIAKRQNLNLSLLSYSDQEQSLLSALLALKKMGATASDKSLSQSLINKRKGLIKTIITPSWHIAHLTT